MLVRVESEERKTGSCILERRTCRGYTAKKITIEEGRRISRPSKEAKRVLEVRTRSSRRMARNDDVYSFVTDH